MGTYTGPTPTERGIGEKVWLIFISIVAASALVLALVSAHRHASSGRPAVSVSLARTARSAS